ncbi:hypothetical protein SNE40_011061 [Patella caerulea]|uniref:Glycosyltransferase 2-like domain-containing protein n=1 Tax=Patella caerulea TaxID=87958 RepID=A0AAN8K3B3_PATCE
MAESDGKQDQTPNSQSFHFVSDGLLNCSSDREQRSTNLNAVHLPLCQGEDQEVADHHDATDRTVSSYKGQHESDPPNQIYSCHEKHHSQQSNLNALPTITTDINDLLSPRGQQVTSKEYNMNIQAKNCYDPDLMPIYSQAIDNSNHLIYPTDIFKAPELDHGPSCINCRNQHLEKPEQHRDFASPEMMDSASAGQINEKPIHDYTNTPQTISGDVAESNGATISNTDHNPVLHHLKPEDAPMSNTDHNPALPHLNPDNAPISNTGHNPALHHLNPDDAPMSNTDHNPVLHHLNPDDAPMSNTDHNPALHHWNPDDAPMSNTDHNPVLPHLNPDDQSATSNSHQTTTQANNSLIYRTEDTDHNHLAPTDTKDDLSATNTTYDSLYDSASTDAMDNPSSPTTITPNTIFNLPSTARKALDTVTHGAASDPMVTTKIVSETITHPVAAGPMVTSPSTASRAPESTKHEAASETGFDFSTMPRTRTETLKRLRSMLVSRQKSDVDYLLDDDFEFASNEFKSMSLYNRPELETLPPVDLEKDYMFSSSVECGMLDKSNSFARLPVTRSHKPIKPGRQIFRWNLLFNLLVWLVISLPVWTPFVLSKFVSIHLVASVQSLFVLMWMVICILAARNMFRLFWYKGCTFQGEYIEREGLHHLFVLSCYKEPINILVKTVQTVARQKAVHNITMTFSFEETTPDLGEKIQQLKVVFEDSGFARLLFTVHPSGLEDEIPGKCSNSNHGFRKSVEILRKDMRANFDPERIIVTTCDADSQFARNYTGALESSFVAAKDKHNTIYQAPLFYNWGLDGASFITRVTGLVRSTLMLGALIPFNINSMSIFSFSLRLCIDGNFVHPAYQMDDIICLIRWMGVTGRRIRICLLPVPVLSGPTSGSTIELDIIEWARQARRWTIGAAEVFHYFVVKSCKMPKLPALSWGLSFLIYYGILLCSGSLYSLSMSLSVYFIIGDSFVPYYVSYWLYALAATQQFCFLIVFILDVFTTRILNVKEHISFIRNVFQWIMSPVVLLLYSLVGFAALHELVVRGKRACNHKASKKDDLRSSSFSQTR